MPTRLYRVCRAKYARLDGLGSRLAGGRWNSPGRSVVYMAESVSLAVLENLVHMTRQDFPTGYVVVEAVLPDDLQTLTSQDVRALMPVPAQTDQALGDHWLRHRMSAALKVASVVVPREHNYLLNPDHPKFMTIKVEAPIPFNFDPRRFDRREVWQESVSAHRGATLES